MVSEIPASRTAHTPAATPAAPGRSSTLSPVNTPQHEPRGSLDELEKRLARETEIAQRRREKTLRDIERREALRRFDAVKRKRGWRYLMLFAVLTLTAVLVTLVMFRALTIVFS